EKPALLYWMTALGFDAGLGPDLAPRLPVALLSLAFLAFYWTRLRKEFGPRAASYSTAMLATSAGWLTYSHVAVTDVPMAVFFSVAVLLSLDWISRGDRTKLPVAAACLALAALAKGLVPLVLFAPVVAMPILHRRWRLALDWLRPVPLLSFCVIALPWYILVTVRNGRDFVRVFFIEQHFSRFSSVALQHVQPWWFYAPIFLLLLYPWFPLLFLPSVAAPVNFRSGIRFRTLAAVVIFGFLFFTLSLNKLPGYLIPLLPSTFAVLGVGLAGTQRGPAAFIPPWLLIGALPAAASFAPNVLGAHGIRATDFPVFELIVPLLLCALTGAIIVIFARDKAFKISIFATGAAFLWFQFASFPAFDAAGSARPLLSRGTPNCVPAGPRDLVYGLYYYSGKELPKCAVLDQSGTRVVR
ncbi:MAG TPA: glycosyltransferase family 39 protein, partial [Bryobacteraceae bacterium]|nr:glycosyltransferase family 39 protein [Bryobacteraceae bacterium]